MAHIANKIDAKDKTLAEVLRGQRYTVESFQREYRWQREHIEALISDLSISFLKNYKVGDTIEDYDSYDCYYMGPIVLCDEKKELSIVDGQQRLTSFTLLLLFLKHAQAKFNLETELVKDLKQYLYVTKGGKTTLILNVPNRINVLEHLYNSPDTPFKQAEIIESSLEEKSKNNFQDESVENIIERFEDISKLFPSEINTLEILPIFIEWLLEKVVMVEVKAYSLENAFTIFETMNDRGLSLNSTEILKGILLSKIEDEEKSEEMNKFWKEGIAEIKSITGADKDLDFFRAWLRAKYADTIRPTKQGATNEDFELIGTQFHSWVKNNPTKTFLKQSDDYYFFIRSDFDFFSNLYIKIFELKTKEFENFEDIYCSSFYPIADSLSYPLLISPISKIDDSKVIDDKIKLTAKFIDIFTLTRVIIGKAITQSTIRYSMYELVKSVRNLETKPLKERLTNELEKLDIKPFSPLSILHRMDNWGFYHYLFARLLYRQNTENDFSSLLRSKKQNSLILYKFFELEDKPNDIEDISWQLHFNSVAGHCLVRRYDLENITTKKGIKLLNYLVKQGYMPEMVGYESDNIVDFISTRDHRLRELIDDILKF
jgi:uncharacterized protein with ParB-like and HNH nuclease domain